ncbi:MAG: deoxyguanosinetriphosphate triphosphohydrolase [Thiohalophilus sp.]|uniref:deoxyguanosinetriphosphate triphosphohydrolase n=1 Tax=Thiohalophilus sp. TaxID=3028392 RepID=UPI0028704E66|nr:deoxyguanosinetriphosphate triphosphohydrolase [Thiohalophilus sp.]MDR9436907.1 deoxyguanosinetriphosphate triphosphohydrolase [Thiohalophilus sp.]
MLTLAPYAATEENSLGRRIPEESPSYRSEFQRDRDRIVHSAAFRRLEYKTQVFVNHEGDMFRTRLTHSIEVAQLSRSIARILNINEDLSETIALAHDLGHTPFGHAGQDALNACMKEYGGFEHNLQSLRTVDKLEQRYADFEGLNLTFEAREGILKHCSLKHARELGEVGRRFIDKTQPSLEAQAVNLADEIAYNNHDVDDGLRSGLITLEQLEEIELFNDQYREVRGRYNDLTDRRLIHEIIRRMINRQIIDLVETSQAAIETLAPQDIHVVRQHHQGLIGFSEQMRQANLALKQFLRSQLYSHYRVHRMTAKAQRIIQSLFSAFYEDPKLLQPKHQQKVYMMEQKEGANGRARAVADYIAGMTDRYAIAEYARIFDPAELT